MNWQRNMAWNMANKKSTTPTRSTNESFSNNTGFAMLGKLYIVREFFNIHCV